jgi:hypothetical protein
MHATCLGVYSGKLPSFLPIPILVGRTSDAVGQKVRSASMKKI